MSHYHILEVGGKCHTLYINTVFSKYQDIFKSIHTLPGKSYCITLEEIKYIP